jgi:diphthamide synthase (EF-2-diphthine--ammonia ligase)
MRSRSLLNVDRWGENGEFHSFVFDGPVFDNPVKFSFWRDRLSRPFCFATGCRSNERE